MCYTATILPYRVCFIEENIDFFTNFDMIMNIVFGIDIVVSFISAYYDEDNILVTNIKFIALNYIKG